MSMIERMEESPRFKARIAGVFWLGTAVAGSLALVFSGALGIAVNLVAAACYVIATLLVYSLLKPVNKGLSLFAAVSSLIGCTIGTLNTFFPMGVATLPTLFFGVHVFFVGYLILKSTFLPRFVGVLMVLGGLGWMTLSVARLLSLPIGGLGSYLMGLGVLGEMTLTVWLLVKGVNEQRWKEQAAHRSPRAMPA